MLHSKPRIGLLYTIMRKEEQEIAKELGKLGIEVVKIDDKELNFEISASDGNSNQQFKGMELVLVRSMSLTRAICCSKMVENMGIKTINCSSAIEACGNKLYTTMALADNDIPMPKTFLAFDRLSAIEAMDKVGYPCILKPLNGSHGRLVAKIDTKDSAESLLEYKESLSGAYPSSYYVQEYILHGGSDIRTMVIQGKVVGAICRKNTSWKTNTAIGGVPHTFKITPEIEMLSLKAAKAVGADIAAVDLFEVEGKVLVNEVNATPEFGKSFNVYQTNIAEEIAKYVKTVY